MHTFLGATLTLLFVAVFGPWIVKELKSVNDSDDEDT